VIWGWMSMAGGKNPKNLITTTPTTRDSDTLFIVPMTSSSWERK